MISSNQHFSTEQAEAILKRAIDLQAEQSLAKGSIDSNISLTQLCRTATELGIESSHVRQAAQELTGQSARRASKSSADPLLEEREFQVEVKASDFPDLLEFLRAETKSPGTGQVIGGSLEWQAYSMARKELLHVAVIPSEGLTRVKIRTVNPLGGAMRFFYVVPVFIFAMGFIPLASFGTRFFHWTDLVPFVVIALFTVLIPIMFSSKQMPWRKGSNGSESLMNSVADWMEDLRISQGESFTQP